MTDMLEFDDLPDYTIKTEPTVPHRFKVAGEIYEAAPVIMPAARRMLQKQILPRFGDDGEIIDPTKADDLADLFGEWLDMVLLPDSAAMVAKRVADPMRPLSDEQIIYMVVGLITHYGGRPTSPSSPSSDGRPSESGTSTDTPLTSELTPTPSPIPAI